MSPPVVHRFRHIIHRARSSVSRQRKPTITSPQRNDPLWKRLPTSVLVQILAECDLFDIYSLILTCRLLHRRIYRNESAIAQEYLRRRRRQLQFSEDLEYDELIDSPGDDLSFISVLFPPPPPQYSGIDNGMRDDLPEYTLGYLADLTRCWTTCIRLSYYLAEYVVRHHLQTDALAQPLWSSSKTQKEVVYSRAVGLLQARLLYPMAYLVFFLETNATALDSNQPLSQQSILQAPPFTNTSILLSTHHCMHLLCTSVQRLMAPEIPHTSTENWLGLLLTTSTLERLMDFFVAAAADSSPSAIATTTTPAKRKPSSSSLSTRSSPSSSPPLSSLSSSSSTWTRRREFMWKMRADLGEFLALAGTRGARFSFACGGSGSGNGDYPLPSLGGIWFEAAQREICRRGAIPHFCDEVPVLHGSAVVLGCEFCDDGSFL
ncbi:hypothetical protein P170DRAFT_107212 [Aspergillus steynii IBT 23096]|uniref:F-box domain-containing protein n=1 Tax=Aspergillus steynii IBT 23096 TaxID=1392250 RepID=A0A2I2GIA7_9EURO|nr:uncharacterized protein P170DRAFT_107212 [Aspergillus steynii IBT 23096]PLB52604.1 hypothetical protein P170DRAFT_107212 [Aspergillus steynii IBT 23096]